MACHADASESNGILESLGIHLNNTGDQLGQQYITPRQAIDGRGADILIVGRAILDSLNRVKTTEEYQEEGYRAYEELRPTQTKQQ